MSAFEPPSPDGRRRRSQRVVLVLLGAVGVAGFAIAYDAWRQRSAADAGPAAGVSSGAPVAADRVYNNNDYIAGVGYYHAPAHAWFPYPFNYHDPARGYFAGGLWQAVPWIAALTQSYPNSSAVATALAAQREQPRQAPASSYFGGVGGHGENLSRGASSPAARPGIIRGGFGLSAHPSIS